MTPRLITPSPDTGSDDIPSPLDTYREARQRIYGVLLDAHERLSSLQVGPDEPELVVKEWYVSRGNAGDRADYVPARALDWDVPNVERLWFGDDAQDKIARLKVWTVSRALMGHAHLFFCNVNNNGKDR